MDAPNDRPWQRDYTIKQTLVIAETPGLRIIDQTLAPGAYDFGRLPKLDGK